MVCNAAALQDHAERAVSCVEHDGFMYAHLAHPTPSTDFQQNHQVSSIPGVNNHFTLPIFLTYCCKRDAKKKRQPSKKTSQAKTKTLLTPSLAITCRRSAAGEPAMHPCTREFPQIRFQIQTPNGMAFILRTPRKGPPLYKTPNLWKPPHGKLRAWSVQSW